MSPQKMRSLLASHGLSVDSAVVCGRTGEQTIYLIGAKGLQEFIVTHPILAADLKQSLTLLGAPVFEDAEALFRWAEQSGYLE